MKDEYGGELIDEVVALRPRMYSIKKAGSNIKKAKGMKTIVIKKEIMHEHYREAPFERKQHLHKMKISRSEGHDLYGMCMSKIWMRWMAGNGVHTLGHGHRSIRPVGTR